MSELVHCSESILPSVLLGQGPLCCSKMAQFSLWRMIISTDAILQKSTSCEKKKVSWSTCSFPAFISEFDTNHIFRVLSIPSGPFQERKKVISKLKWSFQIACDRVTTSRPFFLDEYLVKKKLIAIYDIIIILIMHVFEAVGNSSQAWSGLRFWNLFLLRKSLLRHEAELSCGKPTLVQLIRTFMR